MDEQPFPRRILMEIAFDGTEYHGWQLQPNGITVQQVIEDRLRNLYAGAAIRLYGSSRTDRGVHAMGMAAHLTVPESPYIPFANLRKALNKTLPESVRIRSVTSVGDDFNARFSALGKAYTYVINRGEKTPFNARYAWHLPDFYRLDSVREALSHLTGTHDFSAFAAEAHTYDDPVRTIYRIEMQEFGSLLCVTFIGNGFMYKMVRSLMGGIAAVGNAKIPPSEIEAIRDSRKRTALIETCPPQGLFLMKVFYQEEEMHAYKLEQPPLLFC